MQNKEQKHGVGLATRVAAFDVTCTSKLEFGHAATIQEFDWSNYRSLLKGHPWVVNNTCSPNRGTTKSGNEEMRNQKRPSMGGAKYFEFHVGCEGEGGECGV